MPEPNRSGPSTHGPVEAANFLNILDDAERALPIRDIFEKVNALTDSLGMDLMATSNGNKSKSKDVDAINEFAFKKKGYILPLAN